MDKIKDFFKRFIPLYIIIGIIAVFVIIDYINYKGYKISFISAYTDENPEGDPEKIYFATPENEETIKLRLRVTKNDEPCANHTIVGIGKNAGDMIAARQVTDSDGYCTFEFASSPVYKKIDTLEAEAFFYEETSAYIIEIRVEETFNFILHKRP